MKTRAAGLLFLTLTVLIIIPVLADTQKASPAITGPTTVSVTTSTITITTVVPAPIASSSATPLSGIAPLIVQFTDTSTGSPTSWSWDFGNGVSSTTENPSYTYSKAGTYTVSLTVSNAAGSNTSTKGGAILVGGATVQTAVPTPSFTPLPEPTPRVSVPVAAFVEEPFIGLAPLSVQFTDLSSGSPTSWQWDFGDGESSTEQDPLHIYSSPGLYSVSLMATNVAGSSNTTGSDRITVLAPPATQSPLSPAVAVGSAVLTAFLAARQQWKAHVRKISKRQ